MKKALLLISALFLSGATFAQTDNRNAVVNVENDYNPEVIEATKKNFTPSDEYKTNSNQTALVFSKTGKTYNGYTSERDITDALLRKEEQFPGYARVGYGLTNDIDAKVAYRLGVGKNGTLKTYAGFDGFKDTYNESYADASLPTVNPGKKWEELNEEIKNMYQDVRRSAPDMKISFLTETIYEDI